MSKETGDKDYKPKHRTTVNRQTPCRKRQRFVKETFQGYDNDSGVSTFVNVWSPERESVEGSEERTMAKQEKSNMDKMMEMFMRMREDDRKEREEERKEREAERLDRQEELRLRKEKRQRDEAEREDRREERRLLMVELREAQPVVPQTVQIMQHKLPTMTESDDVEEFIRQLEVALKSSNFPRDKWKHYLLTQMTDS